MSSNIKRNSLLKKLVSNSRSIITHHIGLPLGIVKMNKIIGWLKSEGGEDLIDLKLFSSVYEKINYLPLGVERLKYNLDYLKEQDKILNSLIDVHYNQILKKCFEIIETYGINQNNKLS